MKQMRAEDRQAIKDRLELEDKIKQQSVASHHTLMAQMRAEDAANPINVLSRRKALAELAALDNPQPPSEANQLAEQVKIAQLRKQHAELTAPPAMPAAPTARVRQPIGPKGAGGYAEYEMPVEKVPDLARSSAASAYRSPFARQLGNLDQQIEAEQAAINAGDHRTGFLGVGTSRAETVAKAQRERLRLLGLELQDKVRLGILTAAEADEEADRLLSGTR